jgi:hypothetical protein
MNQTHFEGPRILALPTRMLSTTRRAQAPGESNDRAVRDPDSNGHNGPLKEPDVHPPAPPPPGVPRHPAEVPPDPAIDAPLDLTDPDEPDGVEPKRKAKGRKH